MTHWHRLLLPLKLVLIFAITASLLQSSTNRSSFIWTTKNARLYGYVISTQRTINVLSCAHHCLLSLLCASFNFKRLREESHGRGICELNSCHSLSNNVESVPADGWLFGFMQGKNWDKRTDFNFTFTNLGATGAVGPHNTAGYKGTGLESEVSLQQGIQIWSVPSRGTYTIEAFGASGADGTNNTHTGTWRKGGRGARIKGTFYFIEGAILKILVGQVGFRVQTREPQPGGGGGGSFVTLYDNTPLIIAGGGAGGSAPWIGYYPGNPGQISENGSIHGGTGGLGGRLYDVHNRSFDRAFKAGAGGGFKTNGANGTFAPGGRSFLNGGEGGLGMSGSQGGFGGGGASYEFAEGGGGYSGGGVVRATRYSVAGGGGSLNRGTRIEGEVRLNKGPGRVEIKLLKPDIG